MAIIHDIDRTRAILCAETDSLHDWANRKRFIGKLEIDSSLLLVRTTLVQPETGFIFFLEADFEDYRSLPPKFTFSSAPWNRSNTTHDYPKQQKENPFRGSSIFHTAPCICAHFNRNAYKEHGGPHGDWGGPESWLQAAKGQEYARATNIPDMLSVIYTRFVYTRGRLSDR